MARLPMTQQPMASLSGSDRALFCSDVHLHDADAALTRRFLQALAEQAAQSSHLFVLGDLFEAWVGDDHSDDCARHCFETLAAIRSAGTSVFVMRGNRDFLLGVPPVSWPAVRPGKIASGGTTVAELLADEVVVDLFGVPCLIAHGDQYCSDDVRYQAFRSLRNSADWQRDFLARPLPERLALAQSMRLQSEREKSDKSQYLMDVNPDAVASALLRSRCEHLVHGHTHRPAVHRWTQGPRTFERWVLPDWQEQPRRGGFLVVTQAGFQAQGDWP